MREVSREHSFRLIYRSDGLWFNHQFHLSYISANLSKQLENLFNTSSDVVLSTTLLKRGPADGNLAILDDICQQAPVIKTYQRYSEKSPERMEKYQNITSYYLNSVKKLWVNVSFQSPIVLGVKHQGARSFKNR